MSVATEISRIQQAKADIKSSIEAKGVTVPSAALINDYSDYVDAIQTGGGGGTPIAVSKDVSDYTVSGYFDFLSQITSVNFPSGITVIGDNCFYNCTGITSIIIPDTVTRFRYTCFNNCTSLTSITIGSGLRSFYTPVFNGCPNLESIVVNSNNAIYDSRNNCNAIIETSTNILKAGCKNTVLPNTVTSIGSSAFEGNTGITSIVIPDSITSIGSSAFRNCTNLTSVTIGSGVTSIGDNVFYGCSKLETIICNATTAPTIQGSTFQSVKRNGTLYVPTGSTGYDVWMGNGYYYLGLYAWTKVQQ